MRCALLLLSLVGCVDGGEDGPCPSGLTPIGITDKRVIDNVLELDVGYTGGCETHDFAVRSGEVIDAESSVILLEIHHYDHGDSCEASKMTTLHIDLSPIPRDSATIEIEQRGIDVPHRFGAVEWTRAVATTLPVDEPVLSIDQTCVGY